MVHTDKSIRIALKHGGIVIQPFIESCLGPNSYDVHLGKNIALIDLENSPCIKNGVIDPTAGPFVLKDMIIPEEGLVLYPGNLYLGVTMEYTEFHSTVATLNGKSSVARFGMEIHCTAGTGDIGFKGHWTLEIQVVYPTRVYAGMPIGQLIIQDAKSSPLESYDNRPQSKYVNKEAVPAASKYFQNTYWKSKDFQIHLEDKKEEIQEENGK